jgi:hypothetical protein
MPNRNHSTLVQLNLASSATQLRFYVGILYGETVTMAQLWTVKSHMYCIFLPKWHTFAEKMFTAQDAKLRHLAATK